jgi:hypothetical protein
MYSTHNNKPMMNSNIIHANKNLINVAISPIITQSAFSIHDCPEYISKERINKMTNIYVLQQLERDYDEFLEKRCQILMLLGIIDEVFDVREQLILRILSLKKTERYRNMKEQHRHLTT